jgi:AAA+ ATPase superfamily predicted ATPase
MTNPFNLTLAHGTGFCNRAAEKTLICNNMRSGIHMVIYAPRRYGKSSLALEAGNLLSDMTAIYVDLFSVTSPEDVAEKIYRAIVTTLGRTAADQTTLATRILAAFKKLRLNLEFDPTTALPEFSVSLGDDPAEVHLAQIISALDQYCATQEIKVCLILDEFQEICELKESKKIEALLRGGMQAAHNVTFLMMGSRRTILRDMFEDRKRPFYKSTYVLPLPPIPIDEFVAFLIDRYATGGQALTAAEAREIVEYVQAFPYYVQKLAMLHFNIMGEQDALARAKTHLVQMEAADFEGIFLGLTNHQKRLLRAIAKHRPAEIHSLSFLVANRLGSQGGVQTSLAKLKKMDLVEKDAGVWRVVDPVLEKWLMAQ